MSLYHFATTKVLLTAIPICSQIVLSSWKAGRGRTQIWQSWYQAANAHYFHPTSKNQIYHPFRYALVWRYFSVSFPFYDVLSQLWQNLRPSSSDYQMEQTWYILMRQSELTSAATVRQFHLFIKVIQLNRLFASIHQYSGIETDVPRKWSELNALTQHNVANTHMDETLYWTRIVKRTFLTTSGKAQRGIHDAFAGHRSVALVLTLFTFYENHAIKN